ncbi:methyltransferase [Saccharopolyspora sp. SCSIO 74807]|uniref:methyltransferase n=1 Tax=Saccharopolyspora sp. SCSIO 74807 TaxID=3118084 RepID=UPI0030CB8CA7
MTTMLCGLVAAPLVTLGLMPWFPSWPVWTPTLIGAGMAVLSAAVHARFAADPAWAAWWWLAVIGTVLGLIDTKHHRLPYPWLTILAIGGVTMLGAVRPELIGWLIGASLLVLALGLLVQWLMPSEVGFGDTLLLAALAPFWAWHGWTTVLTGLTTAHLMLGAFAGLAWLSRLREPSTRIAAGPGLLLGAWIPLL